MNLEQFIFQGNKEKIQKIKKNLEEAKGFNLSVDPPVSNKIVVSYNKKDNEISIYPEKNINEITFIKIPNNSSEIVGYWDRGIISFKYKRNNYTIYKTKKISEDNY